MGASDVSREHLPIPDAPPTAVTALDARDQNPAFTPAQPLNAPAGAPNVVLVLSLIHISEPTRPY